MARKDFRALAAIVRKAGGYNPNRTPAGGPGGGRFASGAGGGFGPPARSGAKKPTVGEISDAEWEGMAGASSWANGNRPLTANGHGRGFGPKGEQSYATTVGGPEGIQVVVQSTRSPEGSVYMHKEAQPTFPGRELHYGGVKRLMASFPRNWTPKLLTQHGFTRI